MMHTYSIESDERKRVSLYIAIASVVLSLIAHKYIPLFFSYLFPNTRSDVPWLISVPSALVIYGFLYWFFDEYLWRWRVLRFLRITRIPNLNGRWNACMKSSIDDFIEQFCIETSIHQTYRKISILLENEDVLSYSLMASFKSFNPDRILLRYEYYSSPKPHRRGKVFEHNGTCHVNINLKNRQIHEPMSGEYYNDHDRGSYGVISFVRLK
jgi:SMODS-associating 2TM, beta-strand rich effector domain